MLSAFDGSFRRLPIQNPGGKTRVSREQLLEEARLDRLKRETCVTMSKESAAAEFWDVKIQKDLMLMSDFKGSIAHVEEERRKLMDVLSVDDESAASSSVFKNALARIDKVEPVLCNKEATVVTLSAFLNLNRAEFEPLTSLVTEASVGKRLKSYLEIVEDIQARQDSFKALLAKKNFSGALELYCSQHEIGKAFKVSDCEHLKLYIDETSRVAFDLVRDTISTAFEELLSEMKWPFISLNQSVHQEGFSSEDLCRLQELAGFLGVVQGLLVDEGMRRRSSSITSYILYDFKPLSLITKLLLKPLVTRFKYHFCGKRMTNNLDRPEWYFTQVSSWIKDCSPFLQHTLQPLLKNATDFSKEKLSKMGELPGELDEINASLEFTRGLVMLIVEKLDGDLPELNAEVQFAHTLDELLIFERELRTRFDYPLSEPGPLSVLSQARYFHRMLEMEKRTTAMKLDGFFASGSAWNTLSVAQEEDFRATECGYNVYRVIQILEERCQSFLQPGHRLQLVTFILDLVEEFRIRILQILQGARENALSNVCVGILNTVDFFIAAMEGWNDRPFYIQMMFYQQQMHGEATEELTVKGLFDSDLGLYTRLRDELLSSVTEQVIGEVKVRSKLFVNDKWFTMVPQSPLLPQSLSQGAVGFLACLQTHLSDLQLRLNNSLFRSFWKSLAADLEDHLMTSLILDKHFNDSGASQLKFDVEKNLIPMFGGYSETPELIFRSLRESISLLTLPHGSAVLLKQALTLSQAIDLEEFGIKRLSDDKVLDVLKSRLETGGVGLAID